MITTSPVPDFITVDELKSHLKKSGTEDDAKLDGFVAAACSAIVERIGQVAVVEAEDVVECRGYRRVIVLEERPAIAVTSVTQYDGTVLPAADPDNSVAGWQLKPGSGLLYAADFARFSGRLTVTYTVGRDPVPGNVSLAALELAGHLWKQSQLNTGSTARPPSFGDDQVVIPGLAYALPIRVRELLGLGKLPTTEILVR
jgi:hypothetical protein